MWPSQTPIPSELRRRLASLGQHASAALGSSRPQTTQDRRGWQRTWRFPTEAGARRWNEEWDDVLDADRAIHPALYSIRGQAIGDRFLDALARVAGAIISDEVRAGTPCPYMEPGWRYDLVVEHAAASSTGSAPLVVKLEGAVHGPDDLRWTSDAIRIYSDDDVPPPVVALWSTRHWSPVDEIYG
jgi:hypothetical protein